MEWAKSTPGKCQEYHHRQAQSWTYGGSNYYREYTDYSAHEQAGSGCGELYYGSRFYSYPPSYGHYGYRRW